MSETYEVNLLRNVNAIGGKSSISKEFVGPKSKQAKDNKKKGTGYSPRPSVVEHRHSGYENGPAEKDQEGSIDITV